jgi:hypothetical protein
LEGDDLFVHSERRDIDVREDNTCWNRRRKDTHNERSYRTVLIRESALEVLTNDWVENMSDSFRRWSKTISIKYDSQNLKKTKFRRRFLVQSDEKISSSEIVSQFHQQRTRLTDRRRKSEVSNLTSDFELFSKTPNNTQNTSGCLFGVVEPIKTYTPMGIRNCTRRVVLTIHSLRVSGLSRRRNFKSQ